MIIHPEAKMVDLEIIEVPYHWKGKVPQREIGSELNSTQIILYHPPSEQSFTFSVDSKVQSRDLIDKLRAESKLAFIQSLHGNHEL